MENVPPVSRQPEAGEESARSAVVASLEILDTPPEREFDTIVQAAQRLLGCKVAVVSITDRDRQWFKAKCGGDATETPRELAFCIHTVRNDAILLVPDATKDARFAGNPLVTGAPHIRFYAGIPIHAGGTAGTEAALAIGTLCVTDDKPRVPSEEEIAILADLAQLVESLLAARLANLTAAKLADERGISLKKLDRTHRQFRQAERMADIGSWRLTLADNAIEWSEQTYVIHGLSPGDSSAFDTALEFYPPRARATIEAAVSRTIATGEPFDVETDFITAQGAERRVRSMGELELIDGVPVALIGVFQDITSRHALEQALRETAATDDLTRIASRGHFNTVLDERIARAHAEARPLALLLIDLDHFKAVNDRCGHLAGDTLLIAMAKRLQAPYLAGSFAARLGGDEFVLIVDCAKMLAGLNGLVRRLLADLRETVSCEGATVPVSATIGIAWFDTSVTSRSSLIHRADVALYQAKRVRRGSAMTFGSDDLIVANKLAAPRLRMIR